MKNHIALQNKTQYLQVGCFWLFYMKNHEIDQLLILTPRPPSPQCIIMIESENGHLGYTHLIERYIILEQPYFQDRSSCSPDNCIWIKRKTLTWDSSVALLSPTCYSSNHS